MTGKEVVQRTVHFQTPTRLAMAKGAQSDIGLVSFAPASDFLPAVAGMNEWGCIWHSLNPEKADQGQVTEHPLADWDQFERYRFPDAYALGRFTQVPQKIADCRLAGQYIVGILGKGPMHLLDDLRGFEQYLCDLMTEPDNITAMLDGIFTFLTGITQQYADHGVDAIFLFDDQAIQTGPIFSMALWRAYLKPRYADLFALAHERGMKVYMHACGDISQHLLDLRECGVDKRGRLHGRWRKSGYASPNRPYPHGQKADQRLRRQAHPHWR